MPDCELILTCPFFNSMKQVTSELTSHYKDTYCHGSYDLCGRYMAYKSLERETNIIKSAVALMHPRSGDEQN